MNIEYVIDSLNGKKQPIIYIWDRNGRERVLKVIRDFQPYFYIPKNEVEIAKSMGLKVDENNIYKDCFGEEVVKVFADLPTDVPKLREKFSRTWEADVLFVNRYLIDRWEEEKEKKEWRICFLDIECDDSSFPNYKSPTNSICSIAFYDNYKNRFGIFVWHSDIINNYVEEKEIEELGIKIKIFYFKSEVEMLNNFFEFVKDLDFDILTGWNVSRFDFPYLIKRAEKIGANYKLLSPLNDVSVNDYGDVRIRGRAVLDLLEIYKMIIGERKSYSLSYISKIELGKGKLFEEEAHRKVGLMWRTNLLNLIKYNVNDVLLCVELDRKLKLIDFMDERRRIIGCTWDSLFSSNKAIDILLLRWGKENKIVFPTKKEGKKNVSFQGAIVFSPKMGLYKNVMGFDFKSLYPSIIQTFNISPEVIREGESENSGKSMIMFDGIELYDSLGNVERKKVWIDVSKEGIIPQLFKKLFELRKHYKSLRDKYEKGSKEWEVYDRKQSVTKYLINAIYGVMSFEGFRFYNPTACSIVTYVGRMLLSLVKELAEKEGFEVLYGDTDSVFVYKNGCELKEYLEFGERVNNNLKNIIMSKFPALTNYYFVLEPKNFYSSIFFTKVKKRYVGKVVWSEGKYLSSPIIEIVGFEVKRSDTSDFTENLQSNIFKIILDEENLEKARIKIFDYIGEEIRKVREGRYSYEIIAIPKGIRKEFNRYKANSPWLRGVLYSNKHLQTNFQPGDKVKLLWIKRVKGKYPPTDVIAFVDGLYIPDEFEVDWDKMLEVNVYYKIRNLFEDFGWNWRDLIVGQSNLARLIV